MLAKIKKACELRQACLWAELYSTKQECLLWVFLSFFPLTGSSSMNVSAVIKPFRLTGCCWLPISDDAGRKDLFILTQSPQRNQDARGNQSPKRQCCIHFYLSKYSIQMNIVFVEYELRRKMQPFFHLQWTENDITIAQVVAWALCGEVFFRVRVSKWQRTFLTWLPHQNYPKIHDAYNEPIL